jgi:hypothetical protein
MALFEDEGLGAGGGAGEPPVATNAAATPASASNTRPNKTNVRI